MKGCILTLTQEEDFVTHTFNRSLLESIEQDVIIELLEDTIALLSDSDDMEPIIKKSLECRLRFRQSFLVAVEGADSRTSGEPIKCWSDLATFIPDLKCSTQFGQPVPSSFSVKVQRKLASTVPPRPIVQVSQEAAFEHLERLCVNASIAIEVLKYHDSHSLMVWHPRLRASQLIDYRHSYSSSRLASHNLRSMCAHYCNITSLRT